MHHPNRRNRKAKALAALSVAAIVAVSACGGDDDDDAAPTTPAGTIESGGSDTTAGASDTTVGGDDTVPAGEDTTPAEGSTEPVDRELLPGERAPEDPPDPVSGGTLVYGLEADSANGWAPYRTSCAGPCFIALSSITDPLLGVSDTNDIVPVLAESYDHNEDYTEWTMTLRDGITFHDGTPFDGEAVVFNVNTCRGSALTATAYLEIADVQAEGQTVTFTLSEPWVALPAYFAGGQCSYMMSKEWLQTLPDIPQRQEQNPFYDAELAATPADGDPASPVGLGAFTFESYSPGNGNSFRAVKNPDYWRGPNGITGEDLPYLDAIEAVVAVDEDGRSNGLQSGEFDVIMTANGDTISPYLDDDSFIVNSSARNGETAYTMLNVAQGTADPEGKNAASPMLNLNCRRALAGAIDRDRIVEERTAGLFPVANGPFPPGSIGYLEDTGYPDFDVEQAQADMETCLSELGTESIEFAFNTTNDPFNVETNTLVISMWTDAFGDQVKATITPIEQGQYIGLALTGAFQAFGWRNHSGIDPDQQRVWWQSPSAQPIGSLAPNFGRIQDPEIDAALATIKSNPDPAARQEAAEAINRRFGEQVYNLWSSWVIWGVVSQPYVHGVQANVLPDGTKGIGLAGQVRHQPNQLWCDDGTCG